MENLKLGDYILFGSFLGESIIWQIIIFNSDGDPLLFSYNILTFRAFDSKGDKYLDDNRKISGSNNWETSNIRQWLNSKDDYINWIRNRPTYENLSSYSQNILMEAGRYDNDKGFLSNGNFTIDEYRLIKPCTRKVVLAEIDKDNNDGILENIEPRPLPGIKFADVRRDRYFKNIEDRVFFLSIKELKEWVVDRGFTYNKKPTVESINKRFVKNGFYFDINRNMDFWLSTPYSNSSNSIYCACNVYNPIEAYHSLIGVVPAMYIKLNDSNIISGDGSLNSEYVLRDDSLINKFRENKIKEKEISRKEISEKQRENSRRSIDGLANMYSDYLKITKKLFLINQEDVSIQINDRSQIYIKCFIEILNQVKYRNLYLLDIEITKCLNESFQIVNNSKDEINAVYFALDKESTSFKELLTIAYESTMHNNHMLFFAMLTIIRYKLSYKQEILPSDISTGNDLLNKLKVLSPNSTKSKEYPGYRNIVEKEEQKDITYVNETSQLNSFQSYNGFDKSRVIRTIGLQKPVTRKGKVKPEFISKWKSYKKRSSIKR